MRKHELHITSQGQGLGAEQRGAAEKGSPFVHMSSDDRRWPGCHAAF